MPAITELPPEGKFVNVTDNGIVTRAAYWFGKWRDVLADGGHLVFTEAATWEHEIVQPQPAPVDTQPAPVDTQPAPVDTQPAPVEGYIAPSEVVEPQPEAPVAVEG